MDFKKRVIVSLGFGILIFLLSMFLPFIPCQTAPLVPNPIYQWTFCTLNPDHQNPLGTTINYFGYTPSLATTYFVVIIISFILAMVILHLVAKNKKNR